MVPDSYDTTVNVLVCLCVYEPVCGTAITCLCVCVCVCERWLSWESSPQMGFQLFLNELNYRDRDHISAEGESSERRTHPRDAEKPGFSPRTHRVQSHAKIKREI